MKRLLLSLNHSLLFLCISIYLGTGGSMLLFTLPQIPEWTTADYYGHLVPQLTAATAFFTPLTQIMLVLSSVMILSEWKRGQRYTSIFVMLAIVGATAVTMTQLLPRNAIMAQGISVQAELMELLDDWQFYNRIRFVFWAAEWAAMMLFFARTFFGAKRAL
jgi:hypothetical protein